MTTAFVVLTVIVLLAYALERNHRRHGRPTFTGSTHVTDRDLERIEADLAATAGRALRPTPIAPSRHPRLRTA